MDHYSESRDTEEEINRSSANQDQDIDVSRQRTDCEERLAHQAKRGNESCTTRESRESIRLRVTWPHG